jgi:hypothetical protein
MSEWKGVQLTDFFTTRGMMRRGSALTPSLGIDYDRGGDGATFLVPAQGGMLDPAAGNGI